jgi:hypothetical protein
MPKKKKTREQKILADKRRTPASDSLYTFTPAIVKSQEKKPAVAIKQTAATISTTSYKYLAGDLRKTFFFTLFIVVGELVIYYITKGV